MAWNRVNSDAPRKIRVGLACAAAMAAGAPLASAVPGCATTSSDQCADRSTCVELDAGDAPDASIPPGGDASANGDNGGASSDGASADLATQGDDLVSEEVRTNEAATGNDSAQEDVASQDAAGQDASNPDSTNADASGGPDATAEGGIPADAGACPSGLLDNVTACTSASPACIKGCGPKTMTAHLGTKGCSCNLSTMVYTCQACAYPTPLPACYMPAATPPACASGVADGVACTTPCSGVCTLITDAGKVDGCVCVQGSGSAAWSCATQWW